MRLVSWLCIPQGVSFPALFHLATSSARKSLTVLTSHWDAVRRAISCYSAALLLQKQTPITSQWAGGRKITKKRTRKGFKIS